MPTKKTPGRKPAPPTGHRSSPLKRDLWVVVAEMTARGATTKEIASATGRSNNTIIAALNHPEIARLVAEFQTTRLRTARTSIIGFADKAIHFLGEVMQNEKESTANRIRAAVELLDRAGMVKPSVPVIEINTAAAPPPPGAGSAITPEQAAGMTDEQLEHALSLLNRRPDVIDAA